MLQSRQITGCCPLDCQDTCSWVAHVENDRVVRLEGAKAHPITRGGLCAKVRDYQTRTYASDRLLYPLRRTGPKGSGHFERISWSQALSTIARRFQSTIDRHGAQALMPLNYLGSMGVVQRHALMRLFNALGATGFHGNLCGASGIALAEKGLPVGFDPEELVNSRLIVLWGANILTTCHHHWHFIKEARRRHAARIIYIDPRRTKTAEQCDQNIAVRPGTDAILAAGIARSMVEQGLANVDDARRVISDLDDYLQQINQWTPDKVSDVCGIEADVVSQLAYELGSARPAVIRSGVGPQQTLGGESYVRGLFALTVLGGHWHLPGGGFFIDACPVFHEERAANPSPSVPSPRSLDMTMLGLHLLDEALSPPIEGLMVWNMNPAVVLPDANVVRKGLSRESLFTVVLEHFMTDTARYADIILPSTTQLEHFDILGAWGHHYISVNHPALAPLGEAKSHGEVMRLLAREMRLSHPSLQSTDEEIAACALPAGIDLEDLKQAGWMKSSPQRWSPSTMQQKLSVTGTLNTPVQGSSGDMLQLLTPKSHHFLNSSFANMARHRKAQVKPLAEIHPSDALQRQMSHGQKVVLSNTRGKLEVTLCVTDKIRPGVISLSGKWWSEPDNPGPVGNLLTPSVWSDEGQPAYNDTFVHVEHAITQQTR